MLIEMDFPDQATAEACWNYVEADEEPLKSLHRAVNRSVIDAHFSLYEAMASP